MALFRVSKAETGNICPLDIPAGSGIAIENNTVHVITLPSDSAGAFHGTNWDVIANVTDLSTVNMTGDISTYFECYGYDETNDVWTKLTAATVRTWDVSNYNYCLVHQVSGSAGANVFFTA